MSADKSLVGFSTSKGPCRFPVKPMDRVEYFVAISVTTYIMMPERWEALVCNLWCEGNTKKITNIRTHDPQHQYGDNVKII